MAVASVLGGLVMITPNSGYVEVLPAIVLGILAGVVTFSATKLMERYLYQVDDPVGGFPVHGVNGLLGSLLVPIFANQEITAFPVNGVLYAPGSAESWTWFALQAVTVIAISALVFVVSFAFVRLLSAVMQVRATYEEEVVGLDAVDHGETTDLVPAPGAVGGSSQSVPARPTL
jgi:Amt family ammonium transporter